MSYDVMVLDRHPRFEKSKEFLSWYDKIIRWDEDLDFNDYSHATKPLQDWFLEIKELIPPLNGPFSPVGDNIGKSAYPEADYSISKDCIYIALSYEKIEETKAKVLELAKKHRLATFDISGIFPFFTFHS